MLRRNAHPRLRLALPGAFLVLLALFLVGAAGATPAKTAGSPSAKRARKAATARRHAPAKLRGAGLKAVIDPVTGKLTRPNVRDDGSLQPQAGIRMPSDEATPIVPIERMPDGSDVARLDERFQTYEVARLGADGKLVRDCIQGSAAVEKVRKAPLPVAPAREVK